MRRSEGRTGKGSEGASAPKGWFRRQGVGWGLFGDTPSTDAEPQLLKQLHSMYPRSVPKKHQSRARSARGPGA